jgi:hypothetical protein
VLIAVIVLAVVATAAAAAAAIATRLLIRARLADAADAVRDDAVAAALAGLDASAPQRPRRIITVEVLNPIELAASRGRLAWLAGSLVPGLTKRVVYDQVVKQMRTMFARHGVVADVHVHTVHPAESEPLGAALRVDVGAGLVDEIDAPVAADPSNPDEPYDDIVLDEQVTATFVIDVEEETA